MNTKTNKKQLKLSIKENGEIKVSKKADHSKDITNQLLAYNYNPSFQRESILFRNSVPKIPSTTHGAFAIYKYPAKFIPQVIAYPLKKYGKPNFRIFDPFAGYGTVGVVSRIYGYDYELWDLNPLTEVIHNTILIENPSLNLANLMKEIRKSNEEFIPKWSRVEYWFPEEFLNELSKTWGYVHSLPAELKNLLFIPMIKVSRFFSWADEKTHKLYKSKYAKKKVKELLGSDWKTKYYKMIEKEIKLLLNRLLDYKQLNPLSVNFKLKIGVDTLETKLEEEANILISSPPYLQAQEYIRSTKLALYWLNYDDNYVKSLGRKEIPYRAVNEIDIHSDLYYSCREKIEDKKLRILYDRYFHAVIQIYSDVGENISDYLCIFIGPAAIRTIPIPIDDIIIEHLQELGWKHEITYIDQIVNRVMFKAKFNPATGLKDKRIKTEHLAVLKRK